MFHCSFFFYFFCFNDTATTEIYTLSLHDALPIRLPVIGLAVGAEQPPVFLPLHSIRKFVCVRRSEEHTSELQSRENLVCRLLLEKKKITFGYGSTPKQPYSYKALQP